jgi:hypothetical protein
MALKKINPTRVLVLVHALIALALGVFFVSGIHSRKLEYLKNQTSDLIVQTTGQLELINSDLRLMAYQDVFKVPIKSNLERWNALVLVDSLHKKRKQDDDAFLAMAGNQEFNGYFQDYMGLVSQVLNLDCDSAKLLHWLQPVDESIEPKFRRTIRSFYLELGVNQWLQSVTQSMNSMSCGSFWEPIKFNLDVINPNEFQKINCQAVYLPYSYVPFSEFTIWLNGAKLPFPPRIFTYPIHCTQSPLQPIYIRMEYEDPVTEVLISQVDTFYLNVTK